MGFIDFFRTAKSGLQLTRWKELGIYQAQFTSFGSDMYKSAVVRSCIRPLADMTAKARPTCSDKNIQNVLNKPNMYMSGTKFIAKIRTHVELMNTAFIYIQRNDRAKVTGLYPVPYQRFEALEYKGKLFIRFKFWSDAMNELVVPWEDLAVIRKDYNRSDIAGDENSAVLDALEMINTANQGILNAVKSTANLRGLLKSTKGMLSDADRKKQKDTFVKEYMSLENSGGIASLDSTQEFTPISMSPVITSKEQMKEFKENVFEYFGINEDIIKGCFTEEQRESFYEARIEPFLIELSEELTNKIFTDRERAFGAYILYESNRLQFASMATKISLYKEVVLYGGMTRNEWRAGCNMAPVEGGDKMIMRKDAGFEDDVSEENQDDESEEMEA